MKVISVIYSDGMLDMVSPLKLQKLIGSGGIVKFQRSDGWVYPDIDPVRGSGISGCRGDERRVAV